MNKQLKLWAFGWALASGFVWGVARADVWSISPGFEGEPAANDPVSQGDDEIRLMRVETRSRLNVEHHFGTVTDADDNGTHRLGSARCFIQTGAPTNLELSDYNNTGGGGTSTLSAAATNSAPSELLGLGRCWLDTDGADGVAGNTDDNSVWIYGASGWTLNFSGRSGTTNLVFNGSFEANSAGATSAPDGWTAVSSPTLAYSTIAVSEGTGRALSVTAAGGTDEGVSLTLAGLKASTQYRVIARANATAGDTCSLRTTGGTVDASDTTTTTGSYETLNDFFTTTAVPADIVLILEANADTDVCLFDEVAVYGPRDSIPVAGNLIEYGCTTANTALTTSFTIAPNPVLTRAVTVPGPGYYIKVVANAAAFATTGNDMQLDARLREDATTVRDQRSAATGINGSTVSVPLQYVKTDPTPGATYSYTLELAENALGSAALRMAAPADLAQSCLSVELVPVR